MKKMATVGVLLLMVGATLGSWPGGAVLVTRAESGGPVVVTSQVTPYGTVLFTGDGMALYMLTFDTQGTKTTPAKSSCSGNCAKAWTPLLAPGPFVPFQTQGGVQASALGTILRSDGTYQVTYARWPLYSFVGDKSPGQTNGENVAAFDGLWYLLTVTGQPDAGVAHLSLENSPGGSVLAASTAFSTTRSMYLLTTDPPNLSTCFAGCARIWPPLLTTGTPVGGSGVDPSGLGTLRRPDGTLQVTYFGWPVYYFAFDLGPGAKSGLTNGENFVDPFNHGIWYLLTPSGKIAPGTPAVTTTTTPLGTALAAKPIPSATASYPVYAFSADAGTSSACTGLCARIFVPLLTNGTPQAAAGVSGTELGTVQRPDGTMQVTANGHPLYLFSLDFSGTGGQLQRAFGGTFTLLQASGTSLTTVPPSRAVIPIPQLAATASGMTSSFVVAFSSVAPGHGEVYFGPGPGCSGLVEVATQDTGAGTTEHRVVVSGNELPGSVGANGLQPGVTYSFEVVTVTTTGQEVGNNKGSCYTVTIPAL